jgi:hypothetical protein
VKQSRGQTTAAAVMSACASHLDRREHDDDRECEKEELCCKRIAAITTAVWIYAALLAVATVAFLHHAGMNLVMATIEVHLHCVSDGQATLVVWLTMHENPSAVATPNSVSIAVGAS